MTTPTRSDEPRTIYLELGTKRVFACALEWPGWCRTPLVPKGWPPRYAARRIAWHVLDHAWEMEDRSEPAR